MEGVFRSFIRDLFTVQNDSRTHGDPESEQRIDGNSHCYPNCDASIWMRSCEKEIIEPIRGVVRGKIPLWLNGSLLRNGPGNWKVGDMQFQHLFDCSALLHRFSIENGDVTYQCRFVQTETYKKNMAAQRIVVTEFGTCPVPDPCQSIFQRVSTVFKSGSESDNSMISIYPFGDEYYTFTETPIIHKINIETLDTEARLLVSDYVGIINHTSHPHVMPDRTVYNLGVSLAKSGPLYSVICFPHGENMFEDAHIVCTIPCRWKFHPGYMHTFGLTENFFVIVEQPLSISIKNYIKAYLHSDKLSSCLKWFDDKPTLIHVINRKTGKLRRTYHAEAFFYLHIINQYEEQNHLIIDICCYKDPSMINCMYLESMMNMQNNPNYASMFRGRPLRFVLPLFDEHDAAADDDDAADNMNLNRNNGNDGNNSLFSRMTKSISLSNIFSRISHSFSSSSINNLRRSESEYQNMSTDNFEYDSNNNNHNSNNNYNSGSSCVNSNTTPNGSFSSSSSTSFESTSFSSNATIDSILKNNLVTLKETKAEAYRLFDGTIFARPELLCNLGCETPRYNYEKFLGKKYRYFYAISSDVDAENPGTLIKVDTFTKTRKTWCEKYCFPSEPIFVPSPNSEFEDDGVILSSIVWSNFEENRVGLLVLCARTMTEIGRCEFRTPGPVPKCLHGWFAPKKNLN